MRPFAAVLSLALAGCALAAPPRDAAGPRPHADAAPEETHESTPRLEQSLGSSFEEMFLMEHALYDAPALTEYLGTITRRLAAHAGRPELTFAVSIKDTPEYNAWSVAGGHVHVGRGVLALACSEAEIAGVIAHEIGHVAVRHSLYTYWQQQFGYTDDPALPFPTSLHDRDAEMQADRIGFDLLRASGYAVRAMPRMLRALTIMDLLKVRVDPTMIPRIARLSRYGIPADGGEVGKDAYLDHLDGIVFGDDPRDGVLRGQAFTCARCKLAFDLPAGWKGEIDPDGLGGTSARGDQTMSFYHLGHPGLPESVRVKLREKLVNASIVRETAAGFPVVIGRVEGKDPPEELALIADGDETYTLMTKGDAPRAALRRMLATLRRPRPADMNVTPKRLRVRPVTQQGRFVDVLPRTCKPGSDALLHSLLNDVEMSEVVWEGTRLKCIEP